MRHQPLAHEADHRPLVGTEGAGAAGPRALAGAVGNLGRRVLVVRKAAVAEEAGVVVEAVVAGNDVLPRALLTW